MKTVHLKFSVEELQEVDNWKQEKRIRTRSEAIRQLIQHGLLYEKDAPNSGAFNQHQTIAETGFSDAFSPPSRNNGRRNSHIVDNSASENELSLDMKNFLKSELRQMIKEELFDILRSQDKERVKYTQ